jgi:hypothetical protein
MMRAEEQGEHAQADELAFTARDRGRTVGPLQFLLWHRLQRPDTLDLGTALARAVIDAGDAFVVQVVAGELSAADTTVLSKPCSASSTRSTKAWTSKDGHRQLSTAWEPRWVRSFEGMRGLG